MKRFLKGIVVSILARQVRALRKKHQFKIIGVVGGIGKTSTKLAIAQSLGKTLRVRYQQGNYNDIVTVPLILFGHPTPSLFNPFAWAKVFIDNARQIRGEYPFDVVVVELATDRLGHIAAFGKYLKLDYAVVTAIVPEHMEYLGDMQAVADEELSVAGYSEKLMYNADLVAEEYRQPLASAISYNAIPEAVRAGLEMFYKLEAPQKIAILGNMNQLGGMSAQAHTEIGELCDPAHLDLVVTIGPDANAHLAPAAASKGCTVKSFNTPHEAGEYLQTRIEQGAIVFAKGSQDKVFAEEAIKPLLADPEDAVKLVRQSAYWLKRKHKSLKQSA